MAVCTGAIVGLGTVPCTVICTILGIGVGNELSKLANWAADTLTGCRPANYAK